MNNLSKTNNQWIPLQANVFSRWISSELKQTNHPIDITKDLSDGIALIELAQILTHKKIEQNWSRNPRSSIEKTQNCDLAIDLLKKNGVKIVGISGKDISDNNEKLILGLIWSLISHYSIGKSIQQSTPASDKDNNILNSNHSESFSHKKTSFNEQKHSLMLWANQRTQKYPYIHNFRPYELAMCALLDSYFPEKIHYKNINPEKHHNNSELACDTMIELGIPVFIYTDDLEKNDYKVDEKTLLTQLSLVKSSIDQANISNCYEIIDNSQEKKESESESESENEDVENEKEEIEDEIEENEIVKKELKEKEVEAEVNEIVSKKLEEKEDEADYDNEYSSEEDLISEPNEANINDEEIADDEEVPNETTESYQFSSQSNSEENKLGFNIDFQDDTKRHKHTKKRIRICIKGGNDKNGFQINEEEEVKSFMKKYLCLSNIGEGIKNKNVNIRVKYHGKIIEKSIQTPFQNVNVHLRRHRHNEDSESNSETYEYESELSKMSDDVEERFEEENNEYEEDQNDEASNQIDSEKQDELDLEKSAELIDEIEAEVEKEYEAECDEKAILKSPVIESSQIKEKVETTNNSDGKTLNQHQYEGKKFGVVITLKGSDYNNGEIVEENQNNDGPEVRLALTIVHCEDQFLNSAGLKLDLAEENIKNNINQQFVFGVGENYTVVDSEYKKGMVWDVANADETNPPSGTPFYLYPFHGRHNQRFIFENGMIHALQNNQVVTYVGGDVPLVMMPASENLKSRQTFYVKLM